MPARGGVQFFKIRSFVRRTDATGRDEPRLGPQPARKQQRLSDVFSPQQAGGKKPDGCVALAGFPSKPRTRNAQSCGGLSTFNEIGQPAGAAREVADRKSTRLNSS